MLIVGIEQAEAGMKLAADVLHPAQPDQVLLKRGFVLEPELLQKMRQLGVLGVYVDYPALDELDRHLTPALSPERMKIYSQVKATIAAVQKTAQPTVGFADYYVAIREFVLTLFQQGQYPVYLEQVALRSGDQAVTHATAVAHLSLLLGIRLQGYLMDQRPRLPAQHAAEVVNLGIAGMLHDIGKSKLPGNLGSYCAARPPQAEEERRAWEGHAQIGYDMIRGGVESSAAVAVLQHHQRFDGKGFPALPRRNGGPETRKGEDIHVFARILLVADLYDQLTYGAGGEGETSRRPSFEVLQQMKAEYRDWMDPVVFAALGQVVPPFPPGSRVRLTDGTEAVVTALGLSDAYRPVVRRLRPDGWMLEDQPLDLAKAQGLGIETAEPVAVG